MNFMKKLLLNKYTFYFIVLLFIGLSSYVLGKKYLKIEDNSLSNGSNVEQTQQAEMQNNHSNEEQFLNSQEIEKVANIGDNAGVYNKGFNLNDGFADLVDYVTPSVVNISATKIVKSNANSEALEEIDPSLRDLLKNMLPQGEQQEQKMVGLGSGFIIRSDGFIATNNHVINGAENIQITLSDGTKMSAEIYATDKATDIALLKVKGNNLPSLKFGDSSKLRVGEWVITIGNPFGLGGTVSSGIISALGRDINIGPYNDFIQTDASINKGNSGGPMINTKGEVIGINTAIFSTSGGGSIGIGFSVPSNIIKNVVAQLISNKKVVRAYLGVQIQMIDDNIAKSLNLPDTNGALISNVVKDGPADRSGLKSGDVIVAVEGNVLKNSRLLPKIISNLPPKSSVKLSVVSGGIKKEVVVILDEIPANIMNNDEEKEESIPSTSKNSLKEATYHDIGIKAVEINDAIRKYFKLSSDAKGVIVLAVKNNSIAQQKGMIAGFKIISVNQQELQSIDDLTKMIEKNKEKGLLFLLEDLKGGRYFVSISKKEIEQGYVD